MSKAVLTDEMKTLINKLAEQQREIRLSNILLTGIMPANMREHFERDCAWRVGAVYGYLYRLGELALEEKQQ